MLGLMLVILLIAWSMRTFRTSPWIAFGFLWMGITWAPLSGAVPVGYLMADRYLYIPCLGFCTAAVASVDWAWNRLKQTDRFSSRWNAVPIFTYAPRILFALVVIVFFARTMARTLDWRDELSLWQSAVRHSPANAKVFFNLGNAWWDRHDLTQAFLAWTHALEINPQYPQVWLNMGQARKGEGKPVEAESCYRRALEIEEDYGLAHFNFALLLEEQGRDEEALSHYRQAAQTLMDKHGGSTRRALAWYHIARLYGKQGDRTEAERFVKQSLALSPNFAPAHLLLGLLLSGDPAQAQAEFKITLQLDPQNADAWFNLGVSAWMQNQRPDAQRCFQEAVRLNPALESRVDQITGNANHTGVSH